MRGGRRVCRRAGRGRGRGAGGHRPVGRAPSPLTSESLPQTRLSSPAPPAGRRKAPGKRPLWGTLFLGSVYLSAASGSVRALCPTPLPADQRSARRQQRPLRGWLRARPASALPAPPLPVPPPAPPRLRPGTAPGSAPGTAPPRAAPGSAPASSGGEGDQGALHHFLGCRREGSAPGLPAQGRAGSLRPALGASLTGSRPSGLSASGM